MRQIEVSIGCHHYYGQRICPLGMLVKTTYSSEIKVVPCISINAPFEEYSLQGAFFMLTAFTKED